MWEVGALSNELPTVAITTSEEELLLITEVNEVHLVSDE